MTKKQAFITTIFVGAVKEGMDKGNSTEEHRDDMIANVIGAGGAVIMFRWEL